MYESRLDGHLLYKNEIVLLNRCSTYPRQVWVRKFRKPEKSYYLAGLLLIIWGATYWDYCRIRGLNGFH